METLPVEDPEGNAGAFAMQMPNHDSVPHFEPLGSLPVPTSPQQQPQLRKRTAPTENNFFPGPYTPTPPSNKPPQIKGPTLAERWEEFSQSKRWKRIKPFLSAKAVAVYLLLLFLIYLLTDFQIVQDGEAYSPKTKCMSPLILFKDSCLRSHHQDVVPLIDLSNPNYRTINEALKTSTCYLQNYARNMSCITPLAYGQDLRIISMRRRNGEIVHLINPRNPTLLGKMIKIPETNTLLPDYPAVNVSRPLSLTIDYTDSDLTSTKTARFEKGDAFCISSSLDLFDHILPQLGDVSDSKEKTT